MTCCVQRWLWAFCIVVAPAFVAAGCGKKKTRSRFSCDLFHGRTMQCQTSIVALVKERLLADARTGRGAERKALERYDRFRWRFQQRLRKGELKKECRNLGRVGSPSERKRISTMRYCFGRSDCRSFAECALALWWSP